MNDLLLASGILINPLLCGLIALFITTSRFKIKEILTLLSTGLALVCSMLLFSRDFHVIIPWLGQTYAFELRLDTLNRVLLVAINGFALLITLFSMAFMHGQKKLNQYYAWLLLTLGMAAGVLLADNLFLLLLFWEAMLITLIGFIVLGGKAGSNRTALKALIISGVTDVLLLVGVALTSYQAGSATISHIHLPVTGINSIAFLLLAIGAVAKAGAMPFHTWIPDAAVNAPVTFMAYLPAALEKLLGIYLLARISLNLFQLEPTSWLSPFLMILGCATILLAVMMALIQKDYKRLLSYHAVSQVGYMMLGIGTAVPIGIIGGLFHMLNHAMYKSGLFLTSGAVEKRCGTTDLQALGGLARSMPFTFIIFIITAASISGLPPFNGFFSKELIYDGALQRHWIFYPCAVAGSLFTAISFLKLGHAAFLGKKGEATGSAKEVSWLMGLPIALIALGCILFGLANWIPLDYFFKPVLVAAGLGAELTEHAASGFPSNPLLLMGTGIVLVLAFLSHLAGVLRTKSGLKAADHIHHAPGLSAIYKWAEKGYFDPYVLGRYIVRAFAWCLFKVERAIDWLLTRIPALVAEQTGLLLQKLQNGSYSLYILLALGGVLLMLLNLIFGTKG
jgi:NADH-quinone oxidoreductase subunit L